MDKAGQHPPHHPVPVAIGVEAESQIARFEAMLIPASWELGSPARDVIAKLLLHLPAWEIKGATASIVEAWFQTYATILEGMPLDILQDAAKTILTMAEHKSFPTPAQFLEVIEKRRHYWGRRNKLLMVKKLAKCPRKDERPPSPPMSDEEITEQMDRLLKRGKYATRRSPGEEEDKAP